MSDATGTSAGAVILPLQEEGAQETAPPEKHPVTRVQEDLNADILLYNGDINYPNFFELLDYSKESKTRPNLLLILSTSGGDPDAAYRIARCLKATYDKVTVLIAGLCKSAGTLVSLAADELIISESGELGPLDIQLRKRDEIVEFGSGLDTTTALDLLHKKSLDAFRGCMLDLCVGARISTKTAATIAAELTVGLFGKLYEQIDPVRLAETARANTIAIHYGKQFTQNLKEAAVSRLVHDYPAHSYVIDLQEAKNIFKNVREPTDSENEMLAALPHELNPRYPTATGPTIVAITPPGEETQ